jgi:hypothetical protein
LGKREEQVAAQQQSKSNKNDIIIEITTGTGIRPKYAKNPVLEAVPESVVILCC